MHAYTSRQWALPAASTTDGERERVGDQLAHLVGPVGDRLGFALCSDSGVEAVAGREVDGLQRAVHRTADRGAVPALQPWREVEVARALLQAGGELRLGVVHAFVGERGRGDRGRPGTARERRFTLGAPLVETTGSAPAPQVQALWIAASSSTTASGRSSSSVSIPSISSSAFVRAFGFAADFRSARCSDTTRWSHARVHAT